MATATLFNDVTVDAIVLAVERWPSSTSKTAAFAYRGRPSSDQGRVAARAWWIPHFLTGGATSMGTRGVGGACKLCWFEEWEDPWVVCTHRGRSPGTSKEVDAPHHPKIYRKHGAAIGDGQRTAQKALKDQAHDGNHYNQQQGSQSQAAHRSDVNIKRQVDERYPQARRSASVVAAVPLHRPGTSDQILFTPLRDHSTGPRRLHHRDQQVGRDC